MSGLFISFYFHAFNTKTIVVGEGGGGGGGGGGGQNIMAIIKWPPPPNCRIQDVTSLALFVHLSGLFISFYFHAFNT